MDLILWRHADAAPGLLDMDRPLTPLGRKQAQRMARWLDKRLPDIVRVISSPAVRSLQTAQALPRKSETDARVGPEATVSAMLAALGWPGARESVLVVGHQPTLGRVAAYLLSGREQDWALRKGAIVWLRSRVRDGEHQVLLRAALEPDLL